MKWFRCEHPWSVAALLIADAALAFGSRTYTFPLLASVFLVAHLFTGFRLPGPPRALFAILLMVPFGLWSRDVLNNSFTGWFPIDLLFLIGFYGVALGGYILTSAQTAAERQQALASALFAFALAGTAPENDSFAPLLILFLPVLLLQVRRELGLRDHVTLQQIPLARYGIALVLLLITWLGMQALVSYTLTGINRFMTQRMISGAGGGYVGFAHNARVGLSQQLQVNQQGERVMIRLWSEEPMEYLRGAVYDLYDTGTWQIMEETLDVRPSPNQSASSGRVLFNLTGTNPGERLGWVYPDRSMGQTFFLPLGTQVFAAYGRRVMANPAFAVRSGRSMSSGGYEVFSPQSLPNEPTERDLVVPEHLRQDLQELVRSFSPDTDPLPLRIRKLQDWFAEHFEYELGMKRKSDKDPILEFLQDQRRGHCEFFASASVLMLRSVGIPARYVTGFVVREEAGNQLKLARAKDAHAWVEISLPVGVLNAESSNQTSGVTAGANTAGTAKTIAPTLGLSTPRGHWMTFDPTPPSAQPQPVKPENQTPWRDWLSAWWERLMSVAMVGGFGAMLAVLWESTLGLLVATPWYVWAVIALLAMLWVFRADIRQRFRRREIRILSPQARAMQAKLRRAEKLAIRHGVVRPANMTISSFIRLVQQSTIPPETRTQIQALLDEYQSGRFVRR